MPPSRASKKPEPTMADLIESGRHSYAAKRYRQASEFFSRAIRTCPCAEDPSQDRNRCFCMSFERAAAKERSIYRQALSHRACSGALEYRTCDNLYHIDALDFQATAFEALGLIDQAMENAEWMLRLAPELPDVGSPVSAFRGIMHAPLD
ncbi:hypothetical protein E4U11_002789 [Claviceps purpurea]|nr:hypothetical protein E4U11_002789 [Claviceps purpurea]